ncbi:hypothetical protein G6553_09100 [Nocardioides sp. IC4_145]|uniref:PD40 domain-containing protein n=1 Tax=Nocardioides sp. IC4_145 TaxID=2714037 RepID=UPI00140C9682|nr:PD40 domain-containing protein [Nocardioides sp. IC4_145]NHC23328.1 hypothetical protein [Nocardioides sp. IC4_145]
MPRARARSSVPARLLRQLLAPGAALALVLAGLASTTPAAHAAYAGEDGRIAFVRDGQVHTMGLAGGNVRRLTSRGTNHEPAWSPNGRRIAYVHEIRGRRDAWVMDADGTDQRAVTTTGAVASAGVAWSPDGRRLAFTGPVAVDAQGNQQEALLMTPAGRTDGPLRVVGGYETGSQCGEGPEAPVARFATDRHLAWSPRVAGGSRLAVRTPDCRLDQAIGVYDPATGEMRQVMATGGDCCGYADWTDLFFSPTGKLGYTEVDRGPYGEDSAPSRIVLKGFASRGGDAGGAPSPSGRFVALTNDASGTAYVVRARADGTDRKRLALGEQADWGRKP